jgi:hypothetical protein
MRPRRKIGNAKNNDGRKKDIHMSLRPSFCVSGITAITFKPEPGHLTAIFSPATVHGVYILQPSTSTVTTMTSPVVPNISTCLDAAGEMKIRRMDRVLYCVNMAEFMSADGYSAFIRLNTLRLRLLASAHQAQAMIGCLREGPPTREQRSDLADAVDQLGQNVETISDLLHRPVSLSVAYRERLAKCSLRIACLLTQDIPSLNMRRNVSSRMFYVTHGDFVLVCRRQSLQSLMNNGLVRPLTDFMNRRAVTEPTGAHTVDDAVQTVSAAYLRTRGELAFDKFVVQSILPEIVLQLSFLRFRHDAAALWSVTASRKILVEANKLLAQAEIDVRYANYFCDINPGFTYELLLDAAKGLAQAAQQLA